MIKEPEPASTLRKGQLKPQRVAVTSKDVSKISTNVQITPKVFALEDDLNATTQKLAADSFQHKDHELLVKTDFKSNNS